MTLYNLITCETFKQKLQSVLALIISATVRIHEDKPDQYLRPLNDPSVAGCDVSKVMSRAQSSVQSLCTLQSSAYHAIHLC